jgi:carboxypeptidase family protein
MIFLKPQRRCDIVAHSALRFCIRAAILTFIALTLSVRTPTQTMPENGAQLGRVMGTVLDVNGDAIAGATVVLGGPDSTDRRIVVTGENGFFEFDDVNPGVANRLVISATGFADWTSPAITLKSGEFKSLGGIELAIATQETTVLVPSNPVEAATEQVREQEKQRILGIIPNFYVSYDPNAKALTTKLKFELALKVSVDPVTIAGIALVSGAKQAGNTPNYGQGAAGFGKRFGATATDNLTDLMIGGAILPSVLHQDPRYFYQGTGTTKSRIRHAVLDPFIARGDNGKYQPNYSSLGGDLASSALASLYYPRSNRSAGLVFGNFAIQTAERVAGTLAQEFVLGRFTHRGGHIKRVSPPRPPSDNPVSQDLAASPLSLR